MKFRQEDAQKVKEIKAIAREMVFGEGDDAINIFELCEKKAPGVWYDWMVGGFLKFMKESTIEPKTRELILLATVAALRCSNGVLFHTMSALREGVPEEQIFDVLQLVASVCAKVPFVEAAGMIEEGASRFQKAVKEGKVKPTN